jgi:hypothetical protein
MHGSFATDYQQLFRAADMALIHSHILTQDQAFLIAYQDFLRKAAVAYQTFVKETVRRASCI